MQFAFEEYVLDSDRRELTRGSEPVPIGPQVFDLLEYLLRNRAHIVSKDDLIEAIWGGRIISESTLTVHINAVRKAIGDSGEDQRLIRTIARKGYRFVGEVRETSLVGSHAAAKIPEADRPMIATAWASSDRASIAVLPFANLSGDPEQDYFVDGVVEDIITALSHMKWLLVIARNSSFTYKGRAVDVKQVGADLGVRYILEGSMRKMANRVRILGQLVDAGTGVSIWSQRFEGTIEDIFDLQDQMTANVIGALTPSLERAEIERARQKPAGSLGAYDYYLRGVANLHFGTKAAVEEALGQFYKAIELDQEYAAAHAAAAWCCIWRKVNGWMLDRPKEIAEGVRLARRAIELGPNDALALTRGGHALVHLTGDHPGGIAMLDRAKAINPNLASAWFLGGFIRIGLGQPEAAITYMTQAMRLSPLDPEMHRIHVGMALANLLLGRLDEALSWGEQSYRALPALMAIVILAVTHALAGRTEEARRAGLKAQELDPKLRLSNLKDWLPLRRPEDVAVLTNGLRLAGLPE